PEKDASLARRADSGGTHPRRPRWAGLVIMYLDSCILVKLLVAEPDSEFFVRSLEGKPLVTSELAQTEVFSALLARERAGKISVTDRRRAWHEFEARIEAGEIRIEPLNPIVLRKARHSL